MLRLNDFSVVAYEQSIEEADIFYRGLPFYSIQEREYQLSFSPILPRHFFNHDTLRSLSTSDGIHLYLPTMSRVIDNSRISLTFNDRQYENYMFFLRKSKTTLMADFYTRDVQGNYSNDAKSYFFEQRVGKHSATFFLVNKAVDNGVVIRDSVFAYMRYGFDAPGWGVSADREFVKCLDGINHAIDHGRAYYKNIAFDVSGQEGDDNLKTGITIKLKYNDLSTTVEPFIFRNDFDINALVEYKGFFAERKSAFDWLDTHSMRYYELGYTFNDSVTGYVRHIDTLQYGPLSIKNHDVLGLAYSYNFPIYGELSLSTNGDIITSPEFFNKVQNALVISQPFFENDLIVSAFIRNNYTCKTSRFPETVTWDAYVDATLIRVRFFVLAENIFKSDKYDYSGLTGSDMTVKFGFSWFFYN